MNLLKELVKKESSKGEKHIKIDREVWEKLYLLRIIIGKPMKDIVAEAVDEYVRAKGYEHILKKGDAGESN